MEPFYDPGATFLRLPARATRDGERGDVVGTSVDLEVWGALSLREPGGPSAVQPPYFTVAFEPATGRLLSSRVVGKTSAFEVYDDLLWDFIQYPIVPRWWNRWSQPDGRRCSDTSNS